MKSLLAVHHMSNSGIKDTIMNLFGFTNFDLSPSSSYSSEFDSSHIIGTGFLSGYHDGFSVKRINIYTTNNQQWVQQWQSGNYNNTSNPTINYLVNRYNLTITETSNIIGTSFKVVSPKGINTKALAKQFETITGITQATAINYVGDGNRIVQTYLSNGGMNTSYQNGCGDCPAGCTRGKMWNLKINTQSDCSVEFLNVSEWGQLSYPSLVYYCLRGNVVTAVAPVNAQKYFQIYPNPVANTLIILPKQNELGLFSVSIYNQLGIKILEKKISATNNKIQLSVGQLAAGIYHIVLFNAKEKYINTFVKE
jgi:hypothetical protein